MKTLVCCVVVLCLAIVAVIKEPEERGMVMPSLLKSPNGEGKVTRVNHTRPPLKTTHINADGFEDITKSRSCVIKSENALSALHRATSKECQDKISTVACLDQEDKLYPKTLPRLCPLKGEFEKGTYIGCYRDSLPERDMVGSHTDFGIFNSPGVCIDFCLMEGYKYAALQFMSECWCSDSYGRYGTLPQWACSTPCPGNGSETCGGSNANRIFSTGLPGFKGVPSKVIFSKSEVEGLKPMRIVFVMTVHGRAVRQVKRLIKTMYRPYHYFYIHVDIRSEYMYRELAKLQTLLPNLRLSPERFATVWGGISLTDTHFALMRALLTMKDWTWDYYMNLSESDYPIKSLSHLEWHLTKYQGNNFIAHANREKSGLSQGMFNTFYECDQHVWHIGKRKLPTGISFSSGSDWLVLYRDFVDYAMADSDPLVRGLKRTFQFTGLSLESFFHTLLPNSPFCDKWINANLRMIKWRRELGCQCQQADVIDWCGCSPNDLKPSDLSELNGLYNRTAYLARKIEAVVSNNVINEIDQHVHKDIRGIVGYGHYWQNDYHYQDGRRKDHDLFTTAVTSMLRRTHKVVRKVIPKCQLRTKKILEATLLFAKDSFLSYLIKYEASVSGRETPLIFESRFDVLHHQREIKSQTPLRKLRMLQVGTDYDVKEQIFRNFGRLIGPHSDISLRHSWGKGPKILIAFSWIDPAGTIAHFKEVQIEQGPQILHMDPGLNMPLRPGEWVIKATSQKALIAEMKFIVLPYGVYDGLPMTTENVTKYHNGPEGHYLIGDLRAFSAAFDVLDRDKLSKRAERDGRRVGAELTNWIDRLSEQVWSTQDICSTDRLDEQCFPLELCKETQWSSLAADPKSEINEYFTYKSLMGYFK